MTLAVAAEVKAGGLFAPGVGIGEGVGVGDEPLLPPQAPRLQSSRTGGISLRMCRRIDCSPSANKPLPEKEKAPGTMSPRPFRFADPRDQLL